MCYITTEVHTSTTPHYPIDFLSVPRLGMLVTSVEFCENHVPNDSSHAAIANCDPCWIACASFRNRLPCAEWAMRSQYVHSTCTNCDAEQGQRRMRRDLDAFRSRPVWYGIEVQVVDGGWVSRLRPRDEEEEQPDQDDDEDSDGTQDNDAMDSDYDSDDGYTDGRHRCRRGPCWRTCAPLGTSNPWFWERWIQLHWRYIVQEQQRIRLQPPISNYSVWSPDNPIIEEDARSEADEDQVTVSHPHAIHHQSDSESDNETELSNSEHGDDLDEAVDEHGDFLEPWMNSSLRTSFGLSNVTRPSNPRRTTESHMPDEDYDGDEEDGGDDVE